MAFVTFLEKGDFSACFCFGFFALVVKGVDSSLFVRDFMLLLNASGKRLLSSLEHP